MLLLAEYMGFPSDLSEEEHTLRRTEGGCRASAPCPGPGREAPRTLMQTGSLYSASLPLTSSSSKSGLESAPPHGAERKAVGVHASYLCPDHNDNALGGQHSCEEKPNWRRKERMTPCPALAACEKTRKRSRGCPSCTAQGLSLQLPG